MSTSPRGTLFVFAGPSGSGKTTICKEMVQAGLGRLSISHTTRCQSSQETDGVEYHFIDRPSFARLIEQGAMAEWAQVHGQLYGTGLAWLHEQLDAGHNVFLDIDVQGMLQLRDKVAQLRATFILPTSIEVLRQRLCGRQRDSEDAIKARLRTAMREFQQLDKFDYLLVNDTLEHTLAIASSIVKAAHDDARASAQTQSHTSANQPGLVRKWRQIGLDGI